MSAASGTEALWFLSRGSGTVCLVLASVVTVLGVLTHGGRTLPGLPRFAVQGLHRNLSLLTLALLVIHVGTAIADPYVPLRIVDAVVPFTSADHPVTVGLGALALDLMAAVVVTALLRHRLGHRVFRVVHWAAYAIWPVALVHAFALGPDVTDGVLLGVALLSVLSVAAATCWRALPVRAA